MLLHGLVTVLLVEAEPGLGREAQLLGLGLVLVNLAQGFQHVLALLREVGGQVHKLPSAVAEAMGQDRLELFGMIARERVAHLDGGWGVGGATGQQLIQVLAGVTVPGNK